MNRRTNPNKSAKANSRRSKPFEAITEGFPVAVQGSAADVATAAMISISRDEELRDMGWRMLLQVRNSIMLCNKFRGGMPKTAMKHCFRC